MPDRPSRDPPRSLPDLTEGLRRLLEDVVRRVVREELARTPTLAEEFLDAEEVAKLLRVRTRTVPQLVRRDGLPCRRAGRRLLFRREEVIRWLDERAARPGAHASRHVARSRALRAGPT